MIRTLKESYRFDNWTIAKSEGETYLWNGQPIDGFTDYFDVCKVEEVFTAEEEIKKLKVRLNTLANDYWFMIHLLKRCSRYQSQKDEAIKNCIERMEFRKPFFDNWGKAQAEEDLINIEARIAVKNLEAHDSMFEHETYVKSQMDIIKKALGGF